MREAREAGGSAGRAGAGDPAVLWQRAVASLDASARDLLFSFRVLLVDDDPELLAAVQRHLQESLPGVAMVAAESGPQALGLLQALPVDVVVSDYMMPGMDGLALLGRVRTQRPDAVLLMLTATADLGVAQKAVNDEHVHSFLTKPVDPDLLVRQVADALLRVLRHRLRDQMLAAQDRALAEVMGLLRRPGPSPRP